MSKCISGRFPVVQSWNREDHLVNCELTSLSTPAIPLELLVDSRHWFWHPCSVGYRHKPALPSFSYLGQSFCFSLLSHWGNKACVESGLWCRAPLGSFPIPHISAVLSWTSCCMPLNFSATYTMLLIILSWKVIVRTKWTVWGPVLPLAHLMLSKCKVVTAPERYVTGRPQPQYGLWCSLDISQAPLT